MSSSFNKEVLRALPFFECRIVWRTQEIGATGDP